MKHENFAPPEYKEGLEADAVCQQCGTVNPEGTLICKTCGNNLRDQRLLRMQADHIMEADNEGGERSVFMLRAVSVLGILLILWFGLNVGRITSMLTSAGSDYDENAVVANPRTLWSAASDAVFAPMQETLSAKFPSASEADRARMNLISTSSNTVASGDYVIFERLGTTLRYAGAATVAVDGNIWRYTASLLDGVEIRGEASILEGILTAQWEQAGALYENNYYAIAGTALPRPDGSIALNGESSHNTTIFSAVAYPFNAR
jgi:hypothetical protein